MEYTVITEKQQEYTNTHTRTHTHTHTHLHAYGFNKPKGLVVRVNVFRANTHRQTVQYVLPSEYERASNAELLVIDEVCVCVCVYVCVRQ